MSQTTLLDIARIIRSKNSSVWSISIDVFFASEEDYQRAQQALDLDTVCRALEVPAERILYFGYSPATLSFKCTVRRTRASGSPGETDLMGCQQFAPLVHLPV